MFDRFISHSNSCMYVYIVYFSPPWIGAHLSSGGMVVVAFALHFWTFLFSHTFHSHGLWITIFNKRLICFFLYFQTTVGIDCDTSRARKWCNDRNIRIDQLRKNKTLLFHFSSYLIKCKKRMHCICAERYAGRTDEFIFLETKWLFKRERIVKIKNVEEEKNAIRNFKRVYG